VSAPVGAPYLYPDETTQIQIPSISGKWDGYEFCLRARFRKFVSIFPNSNLSEIEVRATPAMGVK